MINKEYIEIQELVEAIIDNRGKTVPTSENGIPLIATNCIKHSSIFPTFENIRYINQETYDNWFRAHLKPNDILFVNKGTPGRCCIVPNPVNFVAAQDMVGLRFKKHLNPYYMLAVLRSKEIQNTIENNHVGLVIAHFRKQELVKLKLPILEETIRNKIGDFYEIISKKIELNNRINAELEAMAKTLYDYWFVQFDFPNSPPKEGWQNSKNFDGVVGYKSSGGKMVYNETLKREIPEGWEVKKLKNIAEIIMGQSPKGESYNTDGNGVLLINGAADYVGNYLNPRIFTSEPTRLSKKDDLIFCIRATIGKLTYSEKEYCLGRGVASVRSKTEELREYIYFSLNQEIERFKKHASGSIIIGITKDDLTDYFVLLPNKESLNIFHKIVNPIHQKIRKNLKQNQELSALRDWLLPMLINGQVKVGETEKKEAKIVELNKSQIVKPGDFKECFTDKDKKVCRKMLATFIINESLNDQSFGKTKFEKLLHLAEYHLVKGEFNQNYTVQAAGPYDGAFTKTFWNEVLKGGWFKIEELGTLRRIKAGKNHNKSQKDYGYFSQNLKESIKEFVHKFSNSNYEQPEIISTLFAVWNNRIIRKEIITDELLKEDFLNWDSGKAKYANRIDKALDWMRKEGVIPDGWGKEIKKTNTKNKIKN